MKELLFYEKTLRTDYGEYRLEYHMHEKKEEDMEFYGISILQKKTTDKALCDEATIPAFSDNLEETRDFLKVLVREDVFPVHLYSLADDWLAMAG